MSSTERSGLLQKKTGETEKVVEEEAEKEEKNTFRSGIGVVLSSLGTAVGTGNIWRFPRIVAIHAVGGGALVFLIVWFCFLWLWSVPIIILEFAAGRFTRKGGIESMAQLAGPSHRWMGAWVIFVSCAIGCYYSVLVGWCFYYFIYYLVNELPSSYEESIKTWDDLQDSHWPVWCHLLSMVVSGISVSRGVSTIEPLNNVAVPVLLLIVIFSVYWALFLPYAHIGIQKYFTPDWSTLTDSRMWLDAITQNAWDTSAAGFGFLTYAAYMKRTNGAVRIGTSIPLGNNIVSFLCGILVFSCVFSVLIRQGYGNGHILDIIADNGPANTGLTFVWMPILYDSMSGGRFLCILFFLCLTLASLSSMVSLLERVILLSVDFGINRIPATIIITLIIFFVGLGSAINIDILVNQDTVWSYSLLISGLFCVFMVVRYGGEKFRTEIVNQYGIGDWKLPRIWLLIIYILCPIQAAGILIWYIVYEIVENDDEKWYKFTRGSLLMVLSQWAFSFLILIGLNWWMKPLEYHPRDVNAWPHRFLKFIIKPVAQPELKTQVPMMSREIPSDSTETEIATTPLMMDYQESRSNDHSSPVSAGEYTKL